MATRMKHETPQTPPGADVKAVIAWLERTGTPAERDGMARYGLPSDRAFGISVGSLQKEAKQLGKSHDLAAALWDSGWYEARLLACFVDEPARVSAAQMDRWCRDFDNWGVCDTVCFHLFSYAPNVWPKVAKWAALKDEFSKRGAFALLWSLTVHDKAADDAPFLHGLQLIEAAAGDARHFVKKGVDMALRATAKRNAALHAASIAVAERLAAAGDATARWIGQHALREMKSASVVARLAKLQK